MQSLEADRAFLASLTVLYVEDDATIRGITAEYLARRVGRLCLAEDGHAGLEAFRREPPHLVITDIMMPGMDGLAMTEILKQEAPGVPVIVVTAFEQTQFLMRSIALGVERYVLKPVDPDLLDAALLYCAHQLRAEAELRQVQRLERELLLARQHESLCILANGMAHDYNNLLQAILGGVDIAEAQSPNESPAQRSLKKVQRYAEVAKNLGQQLLTLSQAVDQPDLEGSFLPVLEAAITGSLEGSGITVTTHCSEALPVIRCHRERLGQAFSTLLTNAREAMPGGGTLAIEATAHVIGVGEASSNLRPGTYLRVSLRDSGVGMAAEQLAKIFDPYFSSKALGAKKGQGLGLAICRSILLAQGGQVLAESEVGKGSTFHVFLPAVLPPAPGA